MRSLIDKNRGSPTTKMATIDSVGMQFALVKSCNPISTFSVANGFSQSW